MNCRRNLARRETRLAKIRGSQAGAGRAGTQQAKAGRAEARRSPRAKMQYNFTRSECDPERGTAFVQATTRSRGGTRLPVDRGPAGDQGPMKTTDAALSGDARAIRAETCGSVVQWLLFGRDLFWRRKRWQGCGVDRESYRDARSLAAGRCRGATRVDRMRRKCRPKGRGITRHARPWSNRLFGPNLRAARLPTLSSCGTEKVQGSGRSSVYAQHSEVTRLAIG